MKLNLGACDRAFPGFLSVDICPPADVIADLSLPWPWLDASIQGARAHDVFEHIGDCSRMEAAALGRHRSGRIHCMNELHRVLESGAKAIIEVPSATHGAGFAQDPTHQTAWSLNSFQYFEAGSFAITRLARAYGITARFKVLSLGEIEYRDVREVVWKITAVLECVK